MIVWFIFIIKVFIMKVTENNKSLAWNFQRDEICYNVESLENLYFKRYAIIYIITSAKKIEKVRSYYIF